MSESYIVNVKEYICCGDGKELDAGKSEAKYETSL
jgi:hypothetical protein